MICLSGKYYESIKPWKFSWQWPHREKWIHFFVKQSAGILNNDFTHNAWFKEVTSFLTFVFPSGDRVNKHKSNEVNK